MVIRFALMMLGLFILATGATMMYLALVAEILWVNAFPWIGNVPLGFVGACVLYSGWLLTRNMIEDDLEAAD